jgi:hypothetical protein
MRYAIMSLALLGVLPVFGELATITVDVTQKRVSPENPTVNTAASDAVILHIVTDGKELPSGTEVSTTLAGPSPLTKRSDRSFSYSDEYPIAEGSSPLITFRKCDRLAISEYRIVSPESLDMGPPRCPFYTIDETHRVWTVAISQGIILVRVKTGLPVTANAQSRGEEYAFAIQVVNRVYALNWSAGFSFLGLRDEQVRLDPIPGNDSEQSLQPNGHGEVPYQLAAFAHYARLFKWTQSLSLSFGLATKVPVNELTAMIGMTMSLRTLPLVNSGHFTIGIAYGPHKELIPDYRGRATIPAGVSVSSLTSSRYAFAPFAAVTFSFFGGEEQFKGVYAGKNQPTEAK